MLIVLEYSVQLNFPDVISSEWFDLIMLKRRYEFPIYFLYHVQLKVRQKLWKIDLLLFVCYMIFPVILRKTDKIKACNELISIYDFIFYLATVLNHC